MKNILIIIYNVIYVFIVSGYTDKKAINEALKVELTGIKNRVLTKLND